MDTIVTLRLVTTTLLQQSWTPRPQLSNHDLVITAPNPGGFPAGDYVVGRRRTCEGLHLGKKNEIPVSDLEEAKAAYIDQFQITHLTNPRYRPSRQAGRALGGMGIMGARICPSNWTSRETPLVFFPLILDT